MIISNRSNNLNLVHDENKELFLLSYHGCLMTSIVFQSDSKEYTTKKLHHNDPLFSLNPFHSIFLHLPNYLQFTNFTIMLTSISSYNLQSNDGSNFTKSKLHYY